jgi:hypothetical protein
MNWRQRIRAARNDILPATYTLVSTPSRFRRVALAIFVKTKRGAANDTLQTMIDFIIYHQLCDSQSDWTQERRKSEAKAYEEEKMKGMMRSLKATTQAATTQAGK